MKKRTMTALLFCLLICFSGCSNKKSVSSDSDKTSVISLETISSKAESEMQTNGKYSNSYTKNTKISDVISDPVFENYGRLLFPVNGGYYSGNTLGELRLTWYNNVDADKTVEITNFLKKQAEEGKTIFYDIYTETEKETDSSKKDTGLFFFKGNPGEKFAICNAGGGFVYVGAMHDSFPHALELSKKGYNAFALIYRPGAQTACEDLARAIGFIFEHAEDLEIDTRCYSLWGGSAGGRMTAYLSSYGTEAFGEKNYPRPGCAVIQYTGHSEYTKSDPPTFMCVGENDSIANWRIMEIRSNALRTAGINTEFHKYPGLGHGFGLGKGKEFYYGKTLCCMSYVSVP